MIRSLAACAIALLVFCASAQAQEPAGFRVMRAPQPPKIDGVLDDVAWAQVPPMPTGEWASYNPNRCMRRIASFQARRRHSAMTTS